MFTITLDSSSVDRAERMLRDYPNRLRAALKIGMRNSVIEVMQRLKAKVPVRTGNLRRSWQLKPLEQNADGIGWKTGIGSNASYAAAVEFGKHMPEVVRAHTRLGHSVRSFTRVANMPAQPYARPALAESRMAVQRFHELAINAINARIAQEGRGG